MRSWIRTTLAVASLSAVVTAQQSAPPVTSQDILNGLKDSSRWLTFSGDYHGQRHSPLKQLTAQNVKDLSLQWVFQTVIVGFPERGIETTPLMYDGVLYVTGNNNQAFALDARTGARLWQYTRKLPPNFSAYVCCGPVNRGFAILGDSLYMGTLDSHLVSLNRKTGAVEWDVAVGELTLAQPITVAPLVVKDKVIIGIAGSDFANRGFIDAYDAKTGARAWRFYTVPGPGEPGFETWPNAEAASRGGGSAWVNGSYDPDLNLVYIGTGNPSPGYYGGDRQGDNLYTNSLVALDVDTGKLKWHYQFTPHDLHDWDANQVPVLADVQIGGQTRKVVMQANRNGYFYVLDRADGKLLLGKRFIDNSNWSKELGADGRPIVLDNVGTPEKCLPDTRGGTNFQPPSYDPTRRLFFVTAHESCVVWQSTKPTPPIVMGKRVPSGGARRLPGRQQHTALRAIDPATGERKWEYKYRSYPSDTAIPLTGGVMSTASGLVFSGDNEGLFRAFDSSTGKELWRYQTGAPLWGSAPISYMLDGRQWVVVPSGLSLVTFALPKAP